MEVVTGAMSTLLPKLGDLLKEEYELQTGVRGEIMDLKAELESMQAALLKVSEAPIDQPPDIQVKLWARDVKELSYDIEDTIDAFMVRVGTRAPMKLHGLRDFIRDFINRGLNLLSKANVRRKIGTNIRGIKRRIMEVSERRVRYKVDNVVAKPVGPTIDSLRLSALYKKVTELVGTEEKSDGLIKRLMEGDEVSKQQLKIVSIVGFGGLGKTTLANVVYQKLKVQFDCGAFISVSLNPNMEKIFKNMLHQLGKEAQLINDEAQLINELRDFLRNRRLKSDQKTITDSLDYEKVETRKLREEKEDLLKKLQEANSATQKLQGEINKKEDEVRRLQNEVQEKTLIAHEISRIAKDKDQDIERLKSRRTEIELELGRLETKDREKTMILNETLHIARENAKDIKLWEKRHAETIASHNDEIEKLDSRLLEQVVENKQLREASTRNQQEMKSSKINLQDNILLLNNILGELRGEGKTPQEDTIAAHISIIGEQVGTLQELVTTLKANQADSIKDAVEGAISYALAKLKAHDPSLNVQPIEVDFDCREAEASHLIEEMQPVGRNVSEEMQLGSPSSE